MEPNQQGEREDLVSQAVPDYYTLGLSEVPIHDFSKCVLQNTTRAYFVYLF